MGSTGRAETAGTASGWEPGLGLVVPRLWPGETVVVAASGPSLRQEELIFAAARARTIVVNDVYRVLPHGDALYACDPEWWDAYAEPHVWQVDGKPYMGALDFKGFKVTQSWDAAKKWGLHHVPSLAEFGLSRNPAHIHRGSNSGFQALNLAVHLGAAKILLMGFDMGHNHGKTHFFGNHPPGMQKATPFEACIQAFESAGQDLTTIGVGVINVSRESHLKCFPKRSLIDVL